MNTIRGMTICTPFPSVVEVFLLQEDKYLLWKAFGSNDTLSSPSFPEWAIPLKDVFDFPLEPHEKAWLVVKESPSHYEGAQQQTAAQT